MARVRRAVDPAKAAVRGSLHALLQAYVIDRRMVHFSADTLSVRQRSLLLVAEWLEDRDVTLGVQVTTRILERYQRHLATVRKADGHHLGITTQHGYIRDLKAFFAWCVRKGHLPADPAAALDYPRPVKTLTVLLCAADLEAIMAGPDVATPIGVRDRAMLEMLYSTGLRRMELVRVQIDDVDAVAGVMRIVQGKGRKDRLVPIGRRALAWIATYLERGRPLLSAEHAQRTLFLGQAGRPLSRNQVTDLVRGYYDAAGITKKGACHLFRHTMATQLLENGCDIRFIQAMLGHASLNTTAHYAQATVRRVQAAHAAFHPAEQNDDAPPGADAAEPGADAAEPGADATA
jgi:integrase/recombinase XerD